MVEVRQSVDSLGRNRFAEWLDGLPNAVVARLTRGITKLELGNTSDSKSVGQGVTELRLHFGPG